MLKRTIGLFIIFSPFTSYFAISPWLRFPVVLLLFVYLFFLIKIAFGRKIRNKFFSKIAIDDFILLIVITCMIISVLFNGEGLNHLLAYSFVFIMYFVLMKKVVDSENINLFFILRMFAVSAFICGIIIITDWILVNFFSIGFRAYFVSVDNKIANMLYYDKGYFITVGGVAEEPGSMAMLMNIIFPMGILYWRLMGIYWRCVLLVGVYVVSSFFIFSTAGIIAASVSIGCVSLFNLFSRNRGLRINIKTFISLVVIFVFLVIFGGEIIDRNIDTLTKQINEIGSKIFLSNQNPSADIRNETWRSAIKNWEASPIWGNGPGDGVKRYGFGYHSVYLTILADAGILSFLLFLFFILIQILKLRNVPVEYRSYISVALFSSLIHFSILGDFYHAPFWILLILINIMTRFNNSKKMV